MLNNGSYRSALPTETCLSKIRIFLQLIKIVSRSELKYPIRRLYQTIMCYAMFCVNLKYTYVYYRFCFNIKLLFYNGYTFTRIELYLLQLNLSKNKILKN